MGLSPYLPVWPPNTRGGAAPQHKPDHCVVPKKEVAINPINPRDELAMLAFPPDKNQL